MIRTRFAPSPTGYLHIGGLRTALYSYLYAKKNNGKFILRIEDTDQTRLVEGATESLIKMLKTFGIQADEGPDVGGNFGPYIQSQRKELHQKHAQILLEKGSAYHCFCTTDDLTKMREDQTKRKLPPMYDKRCRYLKSEEVAKKLQDKIPFVIRQKIPENQDITFEDLIRGKVQMKSSLIDDQVLIKSDGFPTYHLANVVDDHLMEISHVIRAEEWLPSTPKHILLYQAFGWNIPKFAHLPLLLNPDKSKLSKRQGDVAAEDYLNKGYLKEAILNFVALLGWNPGEGEEQEIFSLKELIQRFSLEHVQKAGAIVNIEKLNWMNGMYIRKKTLPKLIKEILPYLEKEDWFKNSKYKDDLKYLESCLALEHERIKTYAEAPKMVKFFLTDDLNYDKELLLNEKMKIDSNMAKQSLENALTALEKLESYDDEEKIKACLVEVIEKLQVKNGQVLWPIRSALTGEQFSPGVFEVIKILGKERTIRRIKEGIAKL